MKISIGQAAKELGVAKETLRRWEKTGVITADRTKKGHRRYDSASLQGLISRKPSNKKYTVAYARVSSHDQKEDLSRQVVVLESFCAAHGWSFEVLQDLGSGLNYGKKGLRKLIKEICSRKVERLVITHKDRLLRFGAELIFSLCEQFGAEVVILNSSEAGSLEDDLVQDILEIINVFSARLYGSRIQKNKKIVEALKNAAKKL
jgi:predicted site-specific integrase-resolvase